MKYLLPLLLLLGCSPEQDFTVIPVEVSPPIEGPVVLEPGAVPPEVYAANTVETHEQEEHVTSLDVYVLIDQSCSMTLQDDRDVGDALQWLIADVEGSMSPSGTWTVTFGTISSTQIGPLPTFSRPSDPADLPSVLYDIEAAPVALRGGVNEWGFHAAWALLDTGLVPDTTDNKLYIIISDEDDQSYPPDTSIHNAEGGVDYDGDGVADYVSYWWAPEEFSTWAMAEPSTDILFITPDRHSPGANYRETFDGRRYIEASAIHGTHVDFDSDWSGALSSMSWVSVLNDTYELLHDPISGTLKVYVDGTRTWDWTLLGRTLTLTNPPGVGVEVRAEYSYWTI